MNLLKEKILNEGIALNKNVLKVDSFINHQVDVNLMNKIGEEFYNYFKSKEINKVVTIESSGIAPAYTTALKFNVPLVILKKQQSSILSDNLYETNVHSFTKNKDYTLTCSKDFIKPNDNILLIDDFLANGEAVLGACRLFEKSQSNLVGVGIIIEKSFQPGRNKLDEMGLDVYSLAQISKLDKDIIEFN